MRNNRKLWFLSFVLTLAVFTLSISVFLLYLRVDSIGDEPELPKQTEKQKVKEPTEYYEPQDNVGAVSFTEDQMTELVRKMFYIDGFLNDIDIDFDDKSITVSAKIKDKEKLVECYPELGKFRTLLTAVENKKLTATALLTQKDGRAAIKLDKVTVGKMNIDTDLISPFIEEDGISAFFDVEYSDIELTDGLVVFKNDIPDVLKY